MKILIDADEFMNTLNEAQIEGDEYYKGLGKAKKSITERNIEGIASIL